MNPEHAVPEHALFPGPRSGASGQTATGQVYTLDDHRAAHEQEYDRRFAAYVSDRLARFLRDRDCDRLVVIAEPRMLGLLRAQAQDHARAHVEVSEFGKNLTGLTVFELRRRLETEPPFALRN